MSVHPDSETDGFQMRSDHEAIGCAAIDQEETFPGRVGFSWIAYVHCYVDWSHFRTSSLRS